MGWPSGGGGAANLISLALILKLFFFTLSVRDGKFVVVP